MEPMKIIRCEKCMVGHPVFPEGMEENSDETARERCLKEHLAETLFPIRASFVTKRPYFEVWFLARNTRGEKFLCIKSRENIQEPFKYRFSAAVLTFEITGLMLQEQELRQALEAQAFGAEIVLGKDKVDYFVAKLIRETCYKLDRYPDIKWEDISERIEAKNNPDFNVYVTLNGRIVASVLRSCSEFYNKKEMAFLRGFIDRENNPRGVLALLGRRKVGTEYR